jgi:membrane fusion protein, multidrug efflux system
MRGLPVVVIIGMCLLLASCGENRGVAPVAASSPPASAPASPASLPPAEPEVTVSGPIIVEHQLDLAAQRDGVITKIFTDAGTRVKAGTLLAQMDDRQLSANLEAARAKTRSIAADLKNWRSEAQVLEADYARAQRLWDLGLTSEEQLQHAKYKAESDQWDIKRVQETLNTAREEERSLELEVEKTRITAPFGGLVARRYVREGQGVGKGDRLFWLTAEAPLLMRFTLGEKYLGWLHRGRELEIISADLPGEKHTVRIKQVSPVVDPASGTFEVLAEVTGNSGGLRPGMTATIRIEDHR